jgi:shikimate kinase/3-dehydroquinate synthase
LAKVTVQEDASHRPRAAASPKVVFVGFMGSGKSRSARRTAALVGAEAADSDALLEAELGEPIAAFFDREGEAAFRERERALVLALLSSAGPGVIALGGGAVESPEVRERLRDHTCVYLEVEPETAWERAHGSDRPLAREREPFLALHERRVSLYESVARAIVPVGDDASRAGALDAVAALAATGAPAGARMIWAPVGGAGYPVYVGEGALAAAGSLWPRPGRVFTVADARVWALHGSRFAAALGAAVDLAGILEVPPGERHKTLAETERLLRQLAGAGMQRDDTLAAFGGGVVGDLAGFCAAIYQRGVAVVQIPTTLVAQVDSAYGGKTGVDLPEAKNFAGAFHQPAAVICDPGLLRTLPEEELRAGFAEVVKTGLIAGGQLWDRVRGLAPVVAALGEENGELGKTIEGCIRLKLAVTAEDERDLGVRASLNLGHTFAHALEAATGYTRYRHGEAVALGLLVALRLSERELGLDPDVREQVGELLRRNDLPERFEGPSTDELLRTAGHDKKRRGGRRNLVLLRAPGDIAIGCEVEDAALREAIEELRA